MRLKPRRRTAELGKWDSSYPDGSPKRPVRVNYPWFQDHQGNPYFAKPDPRIFDPSKVTPTLQRHAKTLWEEYQRMRLTKLPGEYGLGHTGLPFEGYAIVYQKAADLSTPAMNDLMTYLLGIRWINASAYKSWRDMIKRNEVIPVRMPKWYTNEKSEAPEVTLAATQHKTAKEDVCYLCERPYKGEDPICEECSCKDWSVVPQANRMAFPKIRRKVLSKKLLSKRLERTTPLGRVEYSLAYYTRFKDQVGEQDLMEIKETLDYYIDRVEEKDQVALEQLLAKYNYVPKQKKQSERTSRYQRRQAIPYSKRDLTETWDVWFWFDQMDWDFERDLEDAIQQEFKQGVDETGSGAGPDGRDISWIVDGHLVDKFLAFVEEMAGDYGIKVLKREFQSEYDREREWEEFAREEWPNREEREITPKRSSTRRSRRPFDRNRSATMGDDLIIIDIGPTTPTEQIYNQIEDAMMAVVHNEAEGFRLGRYNYKLDGSGWKMTDYKTDEEVEWYADRGPVIYQIVDDWFALW